ncbi:hypothetical protein GCM10007907_38890 [Chitinimonas prasina]|uniref:Uncharacterized protein n=1 Tax=Chitinimonas prasina TaxID=1434937 RepID=A0ABQ5YKF6_9NEIS|nr:hypothetical protein GCM10007907_38890 [Chitinimonas prasina]
MFAAAGGLLGAEGGSGYFACQARLAWRQAPLKRRCRWVLAGAAHRAATGLRDDHGIAQQGRSNRAEFGDLVDVQTGNFVTNAGLAHLLVIARKIVATKNPAEAGFSDACMKLRNA